MSEDAETPKPADVADRLDLLHRLDGLVGQDYRHHAEELSEPALKLIKAILIKHEAAILSELHTVVISLKDANDMCRSALSVAGREGKEVNWDGFRKQLRESLKRQHAVLWPNAASRRRQR